MTSFSATIAPIIDRLVLLVHRQVPVRRKEAIDAWRSSVGLERIGLLINMRPFILTHKASESIALQLHRYQDAESVLASVADARTLGLFEQEVYMATERGHAAAVELTRIQSEVIEELWADQAEAITHALPLITHAVAHSAGHYSGPAFALFHDFIALPLPEGPDSYRLHHQLTVLRYLRADIHAAALAHAGLDLTDARALNIIWKSQEYESDRAAVLRVIARGLVTPSGDALTPAGVELREKIEHDTDESNDDAYDLISPRDKATLVDSLNSLPSE